MSVSLSPAYRDALIPVVLALADDELVIGHRHSEWTGWAPHIEEDVAFSSIAQDEIGHAAALYQLLSDVTGNSPDKYALGREPGEYRNAQICEHPNGDWAYTLARHFLYDTAEQIRLAVLEHSSYKPLADLAVKLLREERYHLLHADAWFRRLASGPLEGRHQFALALSEALPVATGLFESIELETEAVSNGILPHGNDDLLERWLKEVMGRIEQSGIPFSLSADEDSPELVPTSTGELIERPHQAAARTNIRQEDEGWILEGDFPGRGGRRGSHSEDFAALWDDLTKTYREEPAATW